MLAMDEAELALCRIEHEPLEERVSAVARSGPHAIRRNCFEGVMVAPEPCVAHVPPGLAVVQGCRDPAPDGHHEAPGVLAPNPGLVDDRIDHFPELRPSWRIPLDDRGNKCPDRFSDGHSTTSFHNGNPQPVSGVIVLSHCMHILQHKLPISQLGLAE